MKGKLGSFTVLVLVIAIMGLFALNIYQGYKYERLQAEVALRERRVGRGEPLAAAALDLAVLGPFRHERHCGPSSPA